MANFEDDLEDRPVSAPPEREISLGMGTILGIFLALTLICAAFFGFGYSMGHKATLAGATTVPGTDTMAKTDKADSTFSNFKTAAPTPPAKTAAPAAESGAPGDEPSSTDVPKGETTSSRASEPVVQPAVSADGAWMVQVSATTRKPDAEALTKVLVGKGFPAVIKPGEDQKFHVRVGPFASKKDADTTRKLLVASGYKDPFLTPR